VPIAENLVCRGYSLIATSGTCKYLREHGLICEPINKVDEGRPHIVDAIKNGEVEFIVNTTEGSQAIADSFSIRREALQYKVSYTTTIARGWATLQAIDHEFDPDVRSLQELHGTGLTRT
jgi:carbamoyl-phosphate synthase large subunit